MNLAFRDAKHVIGSPKTVQHLPRKRTLEAISLLISRSLRILPLTNKILVVGEAISLRISERQ